MSCDVVRLTVGYQKSALTLVVNPVLLYVLPGSNFINSAFSDSAVIPEVNSYYFREDY